jgi:hypothetical protein
MPDLSMDAFTTLPNLAVLDLSHNNELELLGRPLENRDWKIV